MSLLVGSLLVPAPLEAVAAPAPGGTGDLTGAMAAQPAPRPGNTPVGDFTDPPPHPSVSRASQRQPPRADPARSAPLAAETTPTKRVVRHSNGSRTVEISSRPVRFQDP